jgi:hypothetical protein
MGAKSHEKPCPSCGHCPTCGRGGYQAAPLWYWWPHPTPYPPTPFWSINPTGTQFTLDSNPLPLTSGTITLEGGN